MRKKISAILLSAVMAFTGISVISSTQIDAQAETADNSMYMADELGEDDYTWRDLTRGHSIWYSYTFKQAGTAQFSVLAVGKDKFKLTVYDENGAELHSYTPRNGADIETMTFGYEAGSTLYLKVYCSSSESSKIPGSYCLVANFYPDKDFETETNDSLDTADEMGTTISGVCVDRTDTDFYKYVTQYGGPVRFSLKNTDSVKGASWFIKVYDSNGKQLQRKTNPSRDFSVETNQFNYPKGTTLYLSVNTSLNASQVQYTIDADESIDDDWETEDNGNLSSADPIKQAATIKGTISNSNDKDYYVFKTSKKKPEFVFTPLNSDGRGTYYIRVYDKNGKSLSFKDAKGNKWSSAKTTSRKTYIINSKKGKKYYICVSSSASAYDKGYSIRIK